MDLRYKPAPFPDSGDAVVIIESFLQHVKSNSPDHSNDAFLALTIISAAVKPSPRLVLRLTVTPGLCNWLGTLHGGAIATIFDTCTSFAIVLVRRPGWWELTGVSRTLDCVYLGAAKVGEVIEIESEIVKIGKRLGE